MEAGHASMEWTVARCVILAILSLTAAILNGTCIKITLKSAKLRSKPSSILLLSLLTLHIFQSLLIIPMQFLAQIKPTKKVTFIFNLFHMMANCGICLHVLAIAIDRLLAVTLFNEYRIIVTKKRLGSVIIILWVYVLLAIALPYAYATSLIWLSFIIIVNKVLPSMAILAIYSYIFYAMKQRLKALSSRTNSRPSIADALTQTMTAAVITSISGCSTTCVSSQIITPQLSVKTQYSASSSVLSASSSISKPMQNRNHTKIPLHPQKSIAQNIMKKIIGCDSNGSNKWIQTSITTTFKIMLSFMTMWIPYIFYSLAKITSREMETQKSNTVEVVLMTLTFIDSICCPLIYCYYNYNFKHELEKAKHTKSTLQLQLRSQSLIGSNIPRSNMCLSSFNNNNNNTDSKVADKNSHPTTVS